MKNMITFAIAALIITFSMSCKKSSISANDTYTTIVKRWNILSDSTFTGVGINNHALNYSGRLGDYFDFRPDGYLYTKEGLIFDTSSYRLTSDTTILINSFGIILNGVTETSHITKFTSHKIIIDAPLVITPGGVFERKVTLTR